MPIELNALESARFGIVAARVTDPAAGPDAIDTAARAMSVDMAMVRLPASDLPRVHAFEAAGYRLMDTLVYYLHELDRVPPRPAPTGDLSCRLAVPADAAGVAAVARAGFARYIGHYHADPRLDSAAADAAYVEWAQVSTRDTGPAAPVLLAETPDGIAGFLTLRQNDAATLEIVLNAVDPACQGRGIYRLLATEALILAQGRGAARVITSTQINNYAVQRVWSRLGFCHHQSVYTFHKWF